MKLKIVDATPAEEAAYALARKEAAALETLKENARLKCISPRAAWLIDRELQLETASYVAAVTAGSKQTTTMNAAQKAWATRRAKVAKVA